MKQFYYFSKDKLKFVEVRNFHRKLLSFLLALSLLTSTIFISAFLLIKHTTDVSELEGQKEEIVDKLQDLLVQYKELDTRLYEITSENNDLRLAANLDPINKNESEFGIGGNVFEYINPVSSSETNKLLNEITFYLDKTSAKVNFEKGNFEEIEKTLETNKNLYDYIPAIKPVDAPYGDRFGMRYHPILKRRRMHHGQDMLADRRTPVYAPGAGVVTFYGRRGGYGNTLEIDHGFGYKTLYAHLYRSKVKVGQKVKRGDLVALSGASGSLSTGPHLHYEVHLNGITQNPRKYILDEIPLSEVLANKK